MKYRFHPEAEEEIQSACVFYESRQHGLGKRFFKAFETALASVLENPLAWGVVEDDYRIRRLHRFPYGILYRIDEDEVIIVAVAHLHRQPGYWSHRK